MDKIISSIHRLLAYIESESYMGYDPYDALTSPIFKNKFLNRKLLRFGIQQIVKRSPINLRPVLAIQKGYNPVTLGLCIKGYTDLLLAFPSNRLLYENKIAHLIHELKEKIPSGYHGACWGYDFPWQARYADIPAFQPTVVATGIITNALYYCFKNTGISEALELCKSASLFIIHDLHRTGDEDSFCFSYSPFDHQQVYNASAKGARLLAQVYTETGNEELKVLAVSAAKYIVNHQQHDGSWFYSAAGRWIDNYHTGYVLDCLDEYQKKTGDQSILPSIQKGYSFYRDHFITKEGIPKIHQETIYPVDTTAAAQSLLTLTRFNDIEIANRVAGWMIDHMQSPAGYFYYRKNRISTKKISFMRWSNAWMFAGLSSLLGKSN